MCALFQHQKLLLNGLGRTEASIKLGEGKMIESFLLYSCAELFVVGTLFKVKIFYLLVFHVTCWKSSSNYVWYEWDGE